ncbi:hypothetical protein LOAG_01683 [Loa loa]|uniref:Uncharacterized protein n=1 Tax=Loa loa TaxID=7209 RepID=A0A1S0U8R8_LOALO|nr:hypothetical protein LOAG_01683 [Loa loa]EFO26797.1 hypothetical protein LOAG_01683 [Loa loa]
MMSLEEEGGRGEGGRGGGRRKRRKEKEKEGEGGGVGGRLIWKNDAYFSLGNLGLEMHGISAIFLTTGAKGHAFERQDTEAMSITSLRWVSDTATALHPPPMWQKNGSLKFKVQVRKANFPIT